MALPWVARGVGAERRYGLIDHTGHEVVPAEWDQMGNVSNGVSEAYNKTDGRRKFSLVDTLGHATPLEYDYCDDFFFGYARVGMGEYKIEGAKPVSEKYLKDGKQRMLFEGKYGYITPDGKFAIPVQFDDARKFGDDGLAPVGMRGKYYVKWGFIDKMGAAITPCNYYSVDYFSGSLALVCKVVTGGKLAYGYIDYMAGRLFPVVMTRRRGSDSPTHG